MQQPNTITNSKRVHMRPLVLSSMNVIRRSHTVEIGHGSGCGALAVVPPALEVSVEQVAEVGHHAPLLANTQHAQVPFPQPITARQLLAAGVAVQDVVVTLQMKSPLSQAESPSHLHSQLISLIPGLHITCGGWNIGTRCSCVLVLLFFKWSVEMRKTPMREQMMHTGFQCSSEGRR